MSFETEKGREDPRKSFFARVSEDQWTQVFEKYRLTPREAEVLRLWMIGLKQHAVAQELGIKTATVRSHVRNINARVGVRNRFELGEKFFDDIGYTSS